MTVRPVWPPNSDEILKSVQQLFADGRWWVYKGKVASSFEESFSASHHSSFGVSVCNGMVALDVVLKALEIGPGDRVVLPAYNYYCLPKSVLNVGATPVFVDILPDNLAMDPHQVARELEKGVRAVVAVHLSGCVARLDLLSELCSQAGVHLLEDCAQAHGATFLGRRVGSWGAAGLFSFGGVKLMTCGQGGMITTSDQELYLRCYAIANRGSLPDGSLNSFGIVGDNFQLSDLAASTLQPQLDALEKLCSEREERMRWLDQEMGRIPGFSPVLQHEGVTVRAQMRQSFYYRPGEGHPQRDQLLDRAGELGIPLAGSCSSVNSDPRLFHWFDRAHGFPNARSAERTVVSFMHHECHRSEWEWIGFMDGIRKIVG